MIRLLLVIAVLFLLYLALRWFARAKMEDAKRAVTIAIISIIVAVLIFLTITGRLHWLIAAIGAAVPIVMRLWRAWRAYRWLRGNKKSPQSNRPNPTAMALNEAYQILGLKPGASKEEIIKAHRQRIRDAHPDRGGSDQQAQQLNAAKELLLKELENK